MKTYGYCRISTRKQNIDRQVRNIKKAYPDAVIIKEAYTGTTTNRPEFNKLLKMIKKQEDTRIVFDSVSRMSRNAEEGFELYQELFSCGVDIVFLNEPQINTDTYRQSIKRSIPKTGTKVDIILDAIQDFLMELAKEQIRLAFDQSQKEVDDLKQRTKEGIETARLNGKQIGQAPGKKLKVKKAIKAKEAIVKYSRDFSGTLPDEECRILCGRSRNSYYKYKKELRCEMSA